MQATAQKISLALLSIALLILILPTVFRIPYRFSITYNEGWNVYHSDRAVKGEKLYDRSRELTPLIYPPLSFYIEGIAGKISGDPLLAGRILAILSLFACGILCGALARVLDASKIGIAFAVLFFIASVAAFAPQYVGMNDPQLLAHVFSITALLCFLGWETKNPVAIAIILAISLFIKHNLIAIPAVIGLELLLRSRKQFLKWLLALFGSLLILTFLTIFISGNAFLDQVFTGRYWNWPKMAGYARSFATMMIVPLIFAAFWILASFKNEKHRPVVLWLWFSIVIGTLATAGFGTAINMYFDAFLCLAVVGGLILTQKPHWVFFGMLFSISILWSAAKQIPQISDFKTKLHQREVVFLKDVDYVREYKGRVGCSNLLLCYSAGREFEFDPFNVSQRIIAGKMQESKVVQLFDSGYFQMVQIKEQRFHFDAKATLTPEMFPDSFFTVNMIAALRRHYSVVRKTDVGAYYSYNEKR
jgi:hypothetical protein